MVVDKIRTNEIPKYIGYSIHENMLGIVSKLARTEEEARSDDFQLAVDLLAQAVAQGIKGFDRSEVEVTRLRIDPKRIAIYRYHNGNRLAFIRFAEDVDPEAVKPLAVQCVAGSPTHVQREDVENLDEMIRLAKEEAIATGKPEAIAEKIATGKVNSQLKEYVFLEQTMYNENITVAKFAERLGVTIKGFHLVN
jgi:translation elongation factor EF-Ts